MEACGLDAAPLTIEPEALGPLGDVQATTTGPAALFPGERRYLSERKLRRRVALCGAVASRVRPLLGEGERVLYLVPVAHIPSTLTKLGLGIWWRSFHNAALVVTDRRLIEVLLDWRRTRPATRTLSYPLEQAGAVTSRGAKLRFQPHKGRTQVWHVLHRGDRRLLKPLVARLTAQDVTPGTAEARLTPVWHCPACGAASASHPKQCAQCGTLFRSPRFAALLSLAFPGGGLLYARRPVLAAFDFLGEAFLAVVVAIVLLSADTPAGLESGVLVGATFFAMTKLESIHLSHLFARRTVPLAPAHRRRWRTFAAVGAVVSALTIATPLALWGRMAPRVDQDLEIQAAGLGWSGGFDPAAWTYGADEAQRSEWVAPDGFVVFVFAYPLGPFESFDELRAALSASDPAHVRAPAPIDGGVGREGLHSVERLKMEEGSEKLLIRYFVFDRPSRDLHVVAGRADPRALDLAEAEMRALIRDARWVPARR